MAQGSGPQLYLTKPVFAFTWNSLWPDSLPHSLPPPVKERSFRAPFGVNRDLYNAALEPWIPFTFAALYVFAVFSLNAYNTRRGNKPWKISRHPLFHYFVVVHNALLTLYSAATFLAMCRAIIHTWPEGGLNNSAGLAGVADALCKMHGPRGLGDATTYNSTINIWEVKNNVIKLGYDGNPDPADVGRLWNEGLAFWGWVFYVSKFYEVIDTLIIIAKGKRSATLQTYHHAGAMICMWAGIRYMSPPIWMFVFVNSFIHALMYTYFTLSAVGVRVHPTIKRTLTSMQIAQFLWGASYAAAHLFVQYDIPIATPYQVAATIQSAASSVSSAASAASSTVSKVIESPAATGTLVALAKKLLLRAVGAEGIAELVTDDKGEHITPHIEEKIEQFNEKSHAPQFETRWRTDWTKTNCIDTSGEAFAIYLNLCYLAPLTFLFARFFIRAYTGRSRPGRATQAAKQVLSSGKVAAKRTDDTVEKLGKKAEDKIIEAEAKAKNVDAQEVQRQLRRDVKAVKEGTFRDRRVSDHVKEFEDKTKTAAEKVAQNVKNGLEKAKQEGSKLTNGSGSPRKGSPTKKQQQTSRSEGTVEHEVLDKKKSKSEKNGKDDNSEERNGQGSDKHEMALEAQTKPQSSSEPAAKQDEILTQSEPARDDELGVSSGEVKLEDSHFFSSSGGGISSQLHDVASYAGAVKDGDDDKDFPVPGIGEDFPSRSGLQHESEQKQDETLIESQPTRPDPSDSVASVTDTDAMGKSGYNVEKLENDQETDSNPSFDAAGGTSS